MSRREIQGIYLSRSGLWIVTYKEEGNPLPRHRFYGPSYKLKDEIDVYTRFTKESEHD